MGNQAIPFGSVITIKQIQMNKHLLFIVWSLFLLEAVFSASQAGDYFGPTPSGLYDQDVFFIGTDMKTPCRLCQIDCQQIPIFKNCQNRYYNYGCHKHTPCARLDTANPPEFHTAVAICLAFNKCEFADVIDNEESYGMYTPFAVDYVEKSVYDILKLSIGRYATKFLNFFRSIGDSVHYGRVESKINDYCTRTNLEGKPACNFLKDTFAKLKDKYNQLVKGINDDKWYLSRKSREAIQILQGYSVEDYNRVFRDEILSKLVPSLPPAVNIYFKFAQDFKIQSEPAIEDIKAMNHRLPDWFKDVINYDDMDGADFYSTKIQLRTVAMNGTRIDRLVDFINQLAADYSTRMKSLKLSFYSLSAGMTNDWQSELEIKDCRPGIKNFLKSKEWLEVECPNNNRRVAVKQTIDNVFDEINNKYQQFIGQLAQESFTPLKVDYQTWSNTRDVLFAVPLSFPSGLQTAPVALPQDKTKIAFQQPYRALGAIPSNYYDKGVPSIRQAIAYSPPSWSASHVATAPPAIIATTTSMCTPSFVGIVACPAWRYKIQAMYYAVWVFVPTSSRSSVDVTVDDIGWIMVNNAESRAISSTNTVNSVLTNLAGVKAGQWNLFAFVAVNGKREGKLTVQFKY